MPETFIRGDFEEKVRQLFFESGLSRQAAAASFDLLKKQVLQNMRPDVQEVSPGNLLRGSPGNLMMYKKWCHASVTRYGPAWTSSGQYQFAAPSHAAFVDRRDLSHQPSAIGLPNGRVPALRSRSIKLRVKLAKRAKHRHVTKQRRRLPVMRWSAPTNSPDTTQGTRSVVCRRG
jgi:hypothetical protein